MSSEAGMVGSGMGRWRARLVALVLAAAMLPVLAGCMSNLPMLGPGTSETRPVAVDAGAAATMITEYRRGQGLGPVRVNATLNAIARSQAEAMAARDELGHDVAGSFDRRVKRGGYQAFTAAENLGAGYDSLEAVMAGWQSTNSHRANLLRVAVTEIGIAAVASTTGRNRVYWALVLAKPLS